MPTPNQLADQLTDVVLDANPVGASLLGIRDREDRLPDLSEAGERAIRGRLLGIAERAGTVDPAPLAGQDRVTLAVVRELARGELDLLAVRAVEYTVTDSYFAPVGSLLMMLPLTGITEPAHADGYLARLAQLPAVLATVAERHRAGIAAGRPAILRRRAGPAAYRGRVPGAGALPGRARRRGGAARPA